jgi:hypothetical protein
MGTTTRTATQNNNTSKLQQTTPKMIKKQVSYKGGWVGSLAIDHA